MHFVLLLLLADLVVSKRAVAACLVLLREFVPDINHVRTAIR